MWAGTDPNLAGRHNGPVTADETGRAHRAADLLGRLSRGEGAALLAGLPPYDEARVIALTEQLRGEGADPELVSAALTQSRLRARAAPRLGPVAARLLLTADGLEQATRPAVAARHARRFVDAGIDHVWDLGSGLGLDALALADAGLSVTAVERDAEVAAAATHNLAPHARARVVHGDVGDAAPAPQDGVWLDPARRTPGVADARGRTRRLFRLDELSPSWEAVRDLAGRSAAAGAKLSPGFSPTDLPPGCEAEWVGLDGAVVECTVWWRAAVRRPGVGAVVGTSGADGTRWLTVDPVVDPPPPLTPGSTVEPFLAEPDRTVLAAGLVGSLSAAVDGRETDHGTGYVVAPEVVDVPWARWFAVEEVLPLHARAVRAWLRERRVDRVTLKKRGVQVDPDRFRAELRLRGRGADEATLVLTRVAGTPSAVVVRPLDGGSLRP